MKIKWILFIVLPGLCFSQSIVGTVHNLSVSGPGSVKALSETEICIFCHTPHAASARGALWNRTDPVSNYTLYNSSSTEAAPGQPSGSSLLCLSCHDGTIALGNVLSRPVPISFSGSGTLAGRGSDLTTNLDDDHPISFTYNSSLAASDGELVDPSLLSGPVHLQGDKMECTSCHDPHSNVYGNFLLATNENSALCLYCHDKNFWSTASHQTSNKTWNGNGTDPWFHTDYTTVSQNACENCHDPHNAQGKERLLNWLNEENNCLHCHNGSVASKNIEAMLSKTYTHNVYNYQQIHDNKEQDPVQALHVECVDCHNPHAANGGSSQSPNVSGALQGAPGIDTNGNPTNNAQYEYEICYRCHADSPNKPSSPTPRQWEQNNVRLEFDLGNTSYHPVEGPGKNTNVRSLISPLTESSTIYCSDCHASDGPGSPKGPHGSIYPRILKFNYNTQENTSESYFAYELCYQCHDRNSIINSTDKFGKDVHKKHIVKEKFPCNHCHDPHGISSDQGSHTALINFNTAVVNPDPNSGRLEFRDTGNYKGECYLECHGKRHGPKTY